MNIRSIFSCLPLKRTPKEYNGVADFLLNASNKEKIKAFKQAAEKANEDQRRIMDAAKIKA